LRIFILFSSVHYIINLHLPLHLDLPIRGVRTALSQARISGGRQSVSQLLLTRIITQHCSQSRCWLRDIGYRYRPSGVSLLRHL